MYHQNSEMRTSAHIGSSMYIAKVFESYTKVPQGNFTYTETKTAPLFRVRVFVPVRRVGFFPYGDGTPWWFRRRNITKVFESCTKVKQFTFSPDPKKVKLPNMDG